LRGYGTFAVEDKETGELVGWAGLWHPARLEEPELCWSVFPAHTGQGHAHEAAGAALVWWTQIEDQPAPFSMTHPDNIASQRVAEKLGAVRGEDFVFDGRPSFFYRHQIGTREEMVH
jgi:RimJ/RimL family protein N-acetyltransferase